MPLSVAVNDQVESAWAVEETRDALDGVRALVGRTGPAVPWRPGGHEVSLEVVERHLDWAQDAVTGRSAARAPSLLAVSPRGCTGAAGGRSPASRRPAPSGEALPGAVLDALGSAPPGSGRAARATGPSEHVAALLGTGRPASRVRTLQTVTREGAGGRARAPPPRLVAARPVGARRGARHAAAALSGVAGGPAWLAGHAAGAVAALHLAVLDPERVAVAALARALIRARIMQASG